MSLTRTEREEFDQVLEQVMQALPRTARRLLERVPVIVEDRPSAEQADSVGVSPDELLGLYTGVPLTERSVEHVGEPAEVIHLFRENLIWMASDETGRLDPDRLREEIRITLLHELGHHYGLDDSRLSEHGY